MLRIALILTVAVCRVTSSSCVYTAAMLASGSDPPAGACAGPMDRLLAKRTALATTKCGLSKVAYSTDGSGSLSCGNCVPGTTFVEDGACRLGQYCTDSAVCTDVTQSPLWGAACPFEVSQHSSVGYCGAGLRCISNQCVECVDGTAWSAFVCNRSIWVVQPQSATVEEEVSSAASCGTTKTETVRYDSYARYRL